MRVCAYIEWRHCVTRWEIPTEGAYEKTIYVGQTLPRYRQDCAAVLSPAAVNPQMQRVSGAVLGTVFRSVSFSADPAFAQEPEPLHALI